MYPLFVLTLIAALQPAPADDPFAPDPAAKPQAVDRANNPVGEDATPVESEKIAFSAAAMSPPILRLNPRGPQARSVAIAFSPDGKTLYAAGYDKVINVWHFGRTADDEYHDRPNHFVPQPERTLRLPVGPGLWGTINALAVSDDGRWLAAGGWGWAEGNGMADFRRTGLIWPNSAFFPDTLEDIGSVFLFDLKTGEVKRLRGHQGPVTGLAFSSGKQPTLVSLGLEQPPGGELKGTARAWNLANGEEIAQIGLPQEAGDPFAPSIAAWRLTDGLVRATFTWSDGWVRVWDIGSNAKPRGFDAKLAMVCAHDPRTGELLHGEFAGGQNRLVRRTLPLNPNEWKSAVPSIAYPSRVAPVAVGFAKGDPGDAGEFLAVVLAEAASDGPKYSLELRRTRGGRAVGKPVVLPFPATPALATSKLGFVAAASRGDGTVLVFKTSALAAGDTRPAEQLDGIGRRITGAAWVRQGDHRGIRFTDGRGTTRVLDLTAGAVSADLQAWEADVADAAAWKVTPATQGNETRLRISGPGGTAATATVPIRSSAFALCPKVPGVDPPILAAAARGYDDAGWLYLFDARTGERLRKLTGHTNAVTNLSFSKDGRLLLSVSADRTVNVWWLGDLVELIGQIGLLRGVNLAPAEGGRLVVKELTDEAPAALRRDMPVGREVHGVVDGSNKLQTFRNPGDFYRDIADRAAGSSLKLRTNVGDVTVTLGQAIDERKPLFTLFFEDDPATGRTSWIGWSPIGPFESSDRIVERLVGWHFNPLQPNAPVRFADLGEYREDFFGRGLLSALVETGRVPEPWPPVEPKMSALFRDGGGTPLVADDGQSLTVETVPAELLVELAGVPADRVASVRWQSDGGEPAAMTPSADARGLWTADLSALQLAAGDHDFTFTAEGTGFDVVRGRVTLRVRPAVVTAPRPPQLPRVVLRSPARDEQVYDPRDETPPTQRIEARIDAYRGPVPLSVEFLQNGEPIVADGNPVRQDLRPSDEASTLSADATLVPGTNRFEVRLLGPDGPVAVAGPVIVTRLQPPIVAALDVPAESEDVVITVKATVQSAKDLEPESVRVTVNGIAVEAKPILEKTADDRWNVTVAEVPLAKALNQIALSIGNADGVAREPGVARVVRVSPAPKPVSIEFAGIASQMTVTARELETTIIVRSSAPLTRATLDLNGRIEVLAVPQPSAPGEYRIQRSLSLNAGVNTLRVAAIANDGGIGQGEARVAVIERPVTIEVDRLVATDGTELLPVLRDDGSVGVNGPVPTDLATLRGRVVWSAAAEKPASGFVYLHSWVNGFLQSSRRISVAGDGLEQPFEMVVALNRRSGNQVRLELPAIAEEDAGRRHVVLDCSDPNARQKVHLLAVGVDVPKADREQFLDGVVESLRGDESNSSSDELVLYPALVGDVYAGDLLARLQLFRYRTPEPGAAHDVLLLYFRGQEAAKTQGHFVLVTSDNTSDPTQDESAVTSARLSDLLEETRGAHLLFLDVARHSAAARRPLPWPRDSHLGVLRNVWLGDGAAPPEYSLMTEFRQASQKERRLRRIADVIERNSRGRETHLFDPYVPSDLSELVLLGPGG